MRAIWSSRKKDKHQGEKNIYQIDLKKENPHHVNKLFLCNFVHSLITKATIAKKKKKLKIEKKDLP